MGWANLSSLRPMNLWVMLCDPIEKTHCWLYFDLISLSFSLSCVLTQDFLVPFLFFRFSIFVKDSHHQCILLISIIFFYQFLIFSFVALVIKEGSLHIYVMMEWLCPNNFSLHRIFIRSPWDASFISYNGKLGNIFSLCFICVLFWASMDDCRWPHLLVLDAR